MRVRHRTPSIFNLSMVDVLCCALGWVILLWLLNLREAKERAVKVGESNEKLQSTQLTLDQTTSRLWLVISERDEAARRAATLAGERDQLRRDLKLARTQLGELDKKLTDLQTRNVATEDRLAKLNRQQETLTREKTAVSVRVTDLEAMLA